MVLEVKKCVVCNCEIQKKAYPRHCRTKKHIKLMELQQNISVEDEPEVVESVEPEVVEIKYEEDEPLAEVESVEPEVVENIILTVSQRLKKLKDEFELKQIQLDEKISILESEKAELQFYHEKELESILATEFCIKNNLIESNQKKNQDNYDKVMVKAKYVDDMISKSNDDEKLSMLKAANIRINDAFKKYNHIQIGK
jgi:hypothetical protein